MKYKIVTSGISKEVTLAEISRNLRVKSEVFILSDKEIYLGMISHKTLTLFLVEFADYAIQNYAKKIIPEAETCIRLTRKWLEDRESVSNEQLIAAANTAYAANAAYAAAYYAAKAASNAGAYSPAAANAAGVDRDKEFLRQGEFIIDFLKSGGHLFLV